MQFEFEMMCGHLSL